MRLLFLARAFSSHHLLLPAAVCSSRQPAAVFSFPTLSFFHLRPTLQDVHSLFTCRSLFLNLSSLVRAQHTAPLSPSNYPIDKHTVNFASKQHKNSKTYNRRTWPTHLQDAHLSLDALRLLLTYPTLCTMSLNPPLAGACDSPSRITTDLILHTTCKRDCLF